jgi:hypothetical protein
MPDRGTRGPTLTSAKQAEQAARDKRLTEALRANLHRRKEQARARQDAGRDGSETETPNDDRGGG